MKTDIPPVDRSKRCTVGEALAPGVPNTEDRGDGQQRGYVILCDEERAKGFVRPVRQTYRHVGARPKYPTRPLTDEERPLFVDEAADINDQFVVVETYPPEMAPRTQRFWTRRELHSGCNTTTKMGIKLAETYARDPSFYSATMCCTCGAHFPVGADGEFVWEPDGTRVGT
jgi:hypothetical protein